MHTNKINILRSCIDLVVCVCCFLLPIGVIVGVYVNWRQLWTVHVPCNIFKKLLILIVICYERAN